MNYKTILICCVSWEDRFLEGLKRNFKKYPGACVKLFHYDEYTSWTASFRAEAAAFVASAGSTIEESALRMATPTATWRRVQAIISAAEPKSKYVIDCSTMPRELLWYLLWALSSRGISAEYVYHRPKSYCKTWLSREPLDPRLVLKMSGIARLGRRTALIAAVGFDTERVANLLRVFEPAKAVLLLQSNKDDIHNASKMKEHRDRFGRFPTVSFREIDAFDILSLDECVRSLGRELLLRHNVLMASLGPKPSAISLFKIQREMPEVGLLYTPAREFNKLYSVGIGDCITGTISGAHTRRKDKSSEWLSADDLDLNAIPHDLLSNA